MIKQRKALCRCNKTISVLPIDYIKLAVNAKNSEIACEAMSGLKDKLIDLQNDIYALQIKNINLEKEKSEAYYKGYKEAFDMYIKTNELYVKLLKAPPQFNLAPNWAQIGLGVLSGGLLCGL